MGRKRYPVVSCLLREPIYKAGDPKPEGYLDFHAWAAAQHKAGLRQSRCRRCKRWFFPQERAVHENCALREIRE